MWKIAYKRNSCRYRLLMVLTCISIFACSSVINFREILNFKIPSKYTISLWQGPSSDKRNTVQRCECINFVGGIGNEMFQFASAYGIAKQKHMMVVVPKHCKLLRIFKLNDVFVTDISFCKDFRKLTEINNAVYDHKMLEFENNSSISLIGYLQAYRYFDKYKSDIQKQFAFINEIKENADKLLDLIFGKYNLTCLRLTGINKGSSKANYIRCYKSDLNINVTLIGVHVRRGDWVLSPHPEAGFQTASKEYLHRAVQWYQHMYKNILFILATNGIEWTKHNMPRNISIVYLEGHSAEIDMAILASCHHFIATTGTFSWWIGWLIGGNVTYFKWPARENTRFRQTFGKDFTDHFYPWWVGL